jgi:hypothetical protein
MKTKISPRQTFDLPNVYYFTDVFTILLHRSIKDLMDHVISEGNRIWGGTERENTWMIYHDHLTIWWEKDSQDYLKTLPCPIEGNPNRTWYD